MDVFEMIEPGEVPLHKGDPEGLSADQVVRLVYDRLVEDSGRDAEFGKHPPFYRTPFTFDTEHLTISFTRLGLGRVTGDTHAFLGLGEYDGRDPAVALSVFGYQDALDCTDDELSQILLEEVKEGVGIKLERALWGNPHIVLLGHHASGFAFTQIPPAGDLKSRVAGRLDSLRRSDYDGSKIYDPTSVTLLATTLQGIMMSDLEYEEYL